MVLKFPSNSQELAEAIAANPGCHVWIDGVQTFVYTGDDIPQDIENAQITDQ